MKTIMIVGFIYQWTNNRTGLKYIGRHEGSPNDGYIGSGTKFIEEYNKQPSDFTREILCEITTSIDDLIRKEEEFLYNIPENEFYYGNNRKYYNLVRNSSGFTSKDNPMNNPEVVARMLETKMTQGTHKNPWQRTMEKYGYDTACKMNKDHMVGNSNGCGNKGKSKSIEHKRKIAKNHKGGRGPSVDLIETMNIYHQYGLIEGAKILNVKYNTFKARVLLAKKNLKI